MALFLYSFFQVLRLNLKGNWDLFIIWFLIVDISIRFMCNKNIAVYFFKMFWERYKIFYFTFSDIRWILLTNFFMLNRISLGLVKACEHSRR